MKKVIWKFQLEDSYEQQIELRKGYEFISAQMQNGNICIWVLLNPNEEKISEQFEIYGTGDKVWFDIGVNREYLATVQNMDLVLHLFKYTGI